MPPTAVILDLDGVLADAGNLHVVAWQRALSGPGWEIPDEIAARAIAMDDRAFAAEIFERREIDDADLDGWVRAKRQLVSRMIEGNPRLFPGAEALVRALVGRVRLALVAATTRREDADALLAAAGLTDAFEVVVAREDASAADAHRAALERLGVAPEEAVAASAAAEGLAAAEAAGARRVAVGHRAEAGDWSAGATFITAVEPLADALDALGLSDRSAS